MSRHVVAVAVTDQAPIFELATANLRQHFSRVTSVSPQTYRRVFRSRGDLAVH